MISNHHTVIPWTVGQLRAALAAYPDDTPVTVAVPDKPGPHADQFTTSYIVSGAAAEQDSGALTIDADFPAGDHEEAGQA